MMSGSLALSAIITIMTALSLIPILKPVSPDSSEGLHQADWTCCHVGYYNEPNIYIYKNLIGKQKQGFLNLPGIQSQPSRCLPDLSDLDDGHPSPPRVFLTSKSVSPRERLRPSCGSRSHAQRGPGASPFFCVGEHANSFGEDP